MLVASRVIRCWLLFIRLSPGGPLQSSLPELLRCDAERPVEARRRVLPRDDHRQLRDGVVVIVPLLAREQLVVDVAVRDRVGVLKRHLLRVAEEPALRVVVERLDLLCRNAEPAALSSKRAVFCCAFARATRPTTSLCRSQTANPTPNGRQRLLAAADLSLSRHSLPQIALPFHCSDDLPTSNPRAQNDPPNV
jgi:hypothetical protein